MSIPLEYNVSDIIGKAQRGLGVSISAREQPSKEKIRRLRDGDLMMTRSACRSVLKLDGGSVKLVAGKWNLEAAGEIEGLARSNTTYHDMTVNAYLVWDPAM
jgi:hypothetical protein